MPRPALRLEPPPTDPARAAAAPTRPPRRPLARIDVVRPGALPAGERERLVDELYAAQVQIFDGVDRAAFVLRVIEPPAETTLQIYRGEGGRPVGYCAHHVFDHSFAGRPVAVIRGEVGILPAYRGGSGPYLFMIRETLRAALRRPGRALYALSTPIHPASYRQVVRFAEATWPSPHAPTPDDARAFVLDLAEQFGYRRVPGRDPWVREIGWRTRESAEDRRSWAASADPAVRLFLALNPDYAAGHGLLTVVPFSVGGLIGSAGRYGWATLRSALRHRRRPSRDS